MTACIVHYHWQGPYYDAACTDRRLYCRRPVRDTGWVCEYHRRDPSEGCRCDLDEARARIEAEQITRLIGG